MKIIISLWKALKSAVRFIFSHPPLPPVEEEPPAPPPEPPVEEEPPAPPPPLPTRDRCIDISNFWLPGPVSDLEARQRMQMIKDAGFVGVICGTQVPSVTNQQIKAAIAVGLWVDVYHYVLFSKPVNEQASQIAFAIEDVKDFVNVVWIDLEETPPSGWMTKDVLDFISILGLYLTYKTGALGIYTRRQWWVDYTSDSPVWNKWLLWCTEYDLEPPYDAAWWERHSFGGWSAPTWVQFLETNLFGMSVDYNERYIA